MEEEKGTKAAEYILDLMYCGCFSKYQEIIIQAAEKIKAYYESDTSEL